MKEIKKRLSLLIITIGLGLLTVSIFLFACTDTAEGKRSFIEPVILYILIIVALFGFFIVEYKKFKFARLIIENKIMHIAAAQIDKVSIYSNSDIKCDEGIEVYISCFGILLDSRVIKFNIDGIKLKVVQIDHESICLSFGTDVKTKKISILHGKIEQQELNCIVERFYYETGVVPDVSDFGRKQSD